MQGPLGALGQSCVAHLHVTIFISDDSLFYFDKIFLEVSHKNNILHQTKKSKLSLSPKLKSEVGLRGLIWLFHRKQQEKGETWKLNILFKETGNAICVASTDKCSTTILQSPSHTSSVEVEYNLVGIASLT